MSMKHLALPKSYVGKKGFLIGDLVFDQNLTIEGIFEGKIVGKGTLHIKADAKVKAKIQVKHLIINGFLEGSVLCSSLTELHESASVYADITTVQLQVHENARLKGHCYMLENEKNIHFSYENKLSPVKEKSI